VKQSTAKILNNNPQAVAVTASAARMSTQQGTALEIFAKSGNPEKDLNLVSKVLSSGHKSVIEHQTLSVAMNDVSVLVEQFVIEFRLASFTVKSRRYVDFSDAGYVIPESLKGETKDSYVRHMNRLFADYGRLMELGIPKEDARFLLPYSLRSNFFMTIDAREMIHMIVSMIDGRGAKFDELRMLGLQLKEQFDELYPNAVDSERASYRGVAADKLPAVYRAGEEKVGYAELVGAPADAKSVLAKTVELSGRFEENDGKPTEDCLKALIHDARPRELEMLSYTLAVRNISLACLTHFTRHRIQSPVIPSVSRALSDGNFIVPDTVKALPEAEKIYREAFAAQAEAVCEMQRNGLPAEILAYYAMSGHVMDIMMTMNARELLHFAKLRTCTRAQWEIRGVARDILAKLSESFQELFENYGPSCAVTGKCPEGKMTCGRPVRIVDGRWICRED